MSTSGDSALDVSMHAWECNVSQSVDVPVLVHVGLFFDAVEQVDGGLLPRFFGGAGEEERFKQYEPVQQRTVEQVDDGLVPSYSGPFARANR